MTNEYEILICVIAFILGYFLYMGNGFSVGGQNNCYSKLRRLCTNARNSSPGNCQLCAGQRINQNDPDCDENKIDSWCNTKPTQHTEVLPCTDGATLVTDPDDSLKRVKCNDGVIWYEKCSDYYEQTGGHDTQKYQCISADNIYDCKTGNECVGPDKFG